MRGDSPKRGTNQHRQITFKPGEIVRVTGSSAFRDCCGGICRVEKVIQRMDGVNATMYKVRRVGDGKPGFAIAKEMILQLPGW